MNNSKRKMIKGWIDKAGKQLQMAKKLSESYTGSSESIEAAQECIEFSVKSILDLLNIKYPLTHGWNWKEFSGIAKQIQEKQLLSRLDAQNLDYLKSSIL